LISQVFFYSLIIDNDFGSFISTNSIHIHIYVGRYNFLHDQKKESDVIGEKKECDID